MSDVLQQAPERWKTDFGRQDRLHVNGLQMAWTGFKGRPGLETYKRLVGQATAAGLWPGWRPRAMAVLRRHADEAMKRAAATHTGGRRRFFPYHPPGGSVLIEVLLWEGDVDGAWEEALGGNCCHRL